MALTALLSVSDKTGIVEFAQALNAQGVRLLSTGGTAKLLAEKGLPVTEVSEITGFPEMLDGRVKTLHPRVHGGILARRDLPEHMAALKEHGIETIDMLVVNLYPFAQATAKADCTLENAIENIDIGGPTMLRAAAKNWQDVAVIIDPVDYEQVLSEMKAEGITRSTKFMLAKKVFAHTAAYDGMITNYLTSLEAGSELKTEAVPAKEAYPAVFNLQLHKVQGMRYGENPHQSAAFYREAAPVAGTLSQWTQIQGKELSFNNIADADAAWECVKAFEECGLRDRQARQPLRRGRRRDAAGGLHPGPQDRPDQRLRRHHGLQPPGRRRCGRGHQRQQAVRRSGHRPKPSAGARAAYAAKQNVRLLEVPIGRQLSNALDFKRVGGGMLLQSSDNIDLVGDIKVVSKVQPTAQQLKDMLFAWTVARFVKSNAIVFCKDGMTMGVGAGQMSRLDSARIASIKAQPRRLDPAGHSAVASDAFFPFRDGLDVVVDAGATCVIHPGGSMRDDEVIAAADERGIAMVFTGTRHFRH
jgi:phosphoribosylaminoimidazolecarboxamide formyltransferase/IMP cyclohydrolase